MRRTNTAQWVETVGRWQINVQKDGVRKTFTSAKPGRTGQKEANAKADKWLDDGIVNTKIKVKQAAQQYLDNLKISSSYGNWRNADSFFRIWILPNIGNTRLDCITEQACQNIINKAYAKGHLSKKSLSNIRATLMAFLKFCRKSKYTDLIIEDLTIPKSASVGERIILQPSDLQTLFSCDTIICRKKEIQDAFIYAYRLQVLTGLRPGELCGLKWSDIKDGTIHLRRSINKEGEITTGKNDNAQRNFALNILTSALLSKQQAMLDKRGIISDYVFPRDTGEPLKSTYYYKVWKRYREQHKLPAASPYELRHTFVSAVKVLPEGYLKQLVGHSKNMDTYGVYSHQITGDMQTAASMVQDVFKSILAG